MRAVSLGDKPVMRGSLREYIGHLRYRLRKNEKDRTDPSVGRSRVRECGTSGHAAAHCALRPETRERAALALCVAWLCHCQLKSCGRGLTPVHASSMVPWWSVDGRRPP